MAVSYKDYYKVLEVERAAPTEDIAKSFKKLARKYHPDLNQGDAVAEEKFKEINEAYEVLKDTEKRKLYDQLGHNWQHGQQFQGAPGFEQFNFNRQNFGGFNGGGGDFSDFFESLFGQAGRGCQRQTHFGPDPFGGFSQKQRQGRTIEAEIAISLEDALKGGRRTVTINSTQGPRTLEVNVPAGVREGVKLRLSGQGESAPGGVAGDLLLRITYQADARFTVDGTDISYDVPLAPWEAVLGTKVDVPTLEGSVTLTVPAGTSSGRRFRIRGRGMGTNGQRGDQIVRVVIKSPTELSTQEQDLWIQLRECATFTAREE